MGAGTGGRCTKVEIEVVFGFASLSSRFSCVSRSIHRLTDPADCATSSNSRVKVSEFLPLSSSLFLPTISLSQARFPFPNPVFFWAVVASPHFPNDATLSLARLLSSWNSYRSRRRRRRRRIRGIRQELKDSARYLSPVDPKNREASERSDEQRSI